MTDKNCTRQILGCLMLRPQLLSEVDKYSLTPLDFNTRFEKLIFSAIAGLYNNGADLIAPIDVANYLESSDAAKKNFDNNNGVEFLQDAIEFSSLENFGYYYNKLKKINLLRDLKKQGINTEDFYVEDLTNSKAEEINSNFEKITTQDIVDAVKIKLLKLESQYAKSDEVQTENIADNIDDFLTNIVTTINIGKPIQGEIYNKVINGAEAGALTIRSGSSGLGKTRQAVGDACFLAFPIRYDWNSGAWEKIGNNEKVLFIITEQTMEQVRKMVYAYLSGINESKFKYGNFSKEELKILKQTTQIIKDFKDNFIITKVPNPSIELVKVLVRENCLTKNINHVFYDYIFIGPELLKEFRGFSLRNDEVLLMFATALKDLAVELGVSMFTSTQVNASADDNKNIRNEASLAGGRSTINKADNGAIMARPTKEELDLLKSLISECGEPNLVTDIFKVRSGQWTQVRIWSKVDLGTMRKQDLFITDSRLNAISDFFIEDDYKVDDWDNESFIKIQKYLEGLNSEE